MHYYTCMLETYRLLPSGRTYYDLFVDENARITLNSLHFCILSRDPISADIRTNSSVALQQPYKYQIFHILVKSWHGPEAIAPG